MHRYLLSVKYLNSTIACKAGSKFSLASSPTLIPLPLLSLALPLLTVGLIASKFFLCIFTYVYVYKYAWSYVSMVNTSRIPPWDVQNTFLLHLRQLPQFQVKVGGSGDGAAMKTAILVIYYYITNYPTTCQHKTINTFPTQLLRVGKLGAT